MYEKVLVAVDGSPLSMKAVATARQLKEMGAAQSIALIYVMNFPKPGILAEGLSMDFAPAQYQNELIVAAEAVIERARKELGPDINPKVIIDSGPPPEMILQVAEKDEYDLIIIGKRGLNQLQRLLLGSVSNRVVTLANCSVLVVK